MEKRQNQQSIAANEERSRSLYLPMPRGALPEVLEIFDQPDANAVQSKRDVTNVPEQSLYLMNSPWIAKQTKSIAEKILSQVPGRQKDVFDQRIELAFRLVLGRKPSQSDLERSRKLVEKLGTNAEIGYASLARGLIASGEFRMVE
jgi:hypothetical protein